MKFLLPHDIPFQPARLRIGYMLPRLIWMSIGPCLLIALSIVRMESRPSAGGIPDLLFLGVAAGTPIVRWIAWLRGDRRDDCGGRIGVPGLLRYTVHMILFSGALWALVQFVSGWNAP